MAWWQWLIVCLGVLLIGAGVGALIERNRERILRWAEQNTETEPS